MGTAKEMPRADGGDALATAPTAPGLGLVPGHKRQLRERVEARLSELTRTLLQLDGEPAFEERVRAIEVALHGLDAYVGGGWDNVGAIEAASLSRWLESTALLVSDEVLVVLVGDEILDDARRRGEEEDEDAPGATRPPGEA